MLSFNIIAKKDRSKNVVYKIIFLLLSARCWWSKSSHGSVPICTSSEAKGETTLLHKGYTILSEFVCLRYTTLQSMMNAKLSQKRVWSSNVIVLIKASRWVSSRLLILDEPILKVGLNLFLPKFGIARGLESYACLYAQGDFLWIFNRNCFFSSLRAFLRKYFFWLLTVEENQSWILME